MINKEEIRLSLPPDLYSRNYFISQGIKEYKKRNDLEKIKVLDIGGRNGRMELFLDPQDELLLLDIRKGPESNLIVGDATDLKEFSDGYFDVVVSGDVFEHVPPQKRECFLLESLRVAKGLVVHAAPFDDLGVRGAEIQANNFFRKINGNDHLWLKEHIENGLPKFEDLEKIVNSRGFRCDVIKSNNLSNWILLQYVIFCAYNFILDIDDFYRFYNQNLLSLEDENEPFYRRIVFISKDGRYGLNRYDFDFQKKQQLLDKAFGVMAESMSSGISKWLRLIRKVYNKKIKGRLSVPDADLEVKKFPESKLAHRYLDGLSGLEIGGSAHNPFGLETKNVDFTAEETAYKREELEKTGEVLPVDIVAPGDAIPVPDESQDFVISSHVLEHFPDPIKALKEWYRIVRPGGYIFMIIPHKGRTFDRMRKRTRPEELHQRHKANFSPKADVVHYSFWTTLDMLDLIQSIDLDWKIVDFQDADDKVGNGFSVVVRKERTDPEKDKEISRRIEEFRKKVKKEENSLLNVLKIRRLGEIIRNSAREYRKNGLRGIIRRSRFMHRWHREQEIIEK